MNLIDIESWLKKHSLRYRSVGNEIIFEHLNGETSILLPRNEWKDGIISISIEPLASFYSSYFGASLGNSQLTFATNVLGGTQISHGFRLHDFDQMANQAHELGLRIPSEEITFLAEAAWMFIYTVSTVNGETIFKKYDRDFCTSRRIKDLDQILNSWWDISIDDQL